MTIPSTASDGSSDSFDIVDLEAELREMRDTFNKSKIGAREKKANYSTGHKAECGDNQSIASTTYSELVRAESDCTDMIDTINERLSTIQLQKGKVQPPSIPFDDKPWVKDAKTWSPGLKSPGMISAVVRMASIESDYYFWPHQDTFGSVKARFAFEHNLAGGPYGLVFNYDGRVLKDSEVPADVDMEDDDIVDCYHDPNTIDWSG